MRFVIREQEYEKLLAAGRLKYLTGAFESWRLTEAVDGYRVMRIDLDRRDAGQGTSTLFHLLLDAGGRLERVKLRHFLPDSDLNVDVLVDGDSFNISRAGAWGAAHDVVNRPAGFGLLLPSLVGMALFVRDIAGERNHSAILLDPARQFAPRQVTVKIETLEEEELAVTGQTLVVRPHLIDQNGTRQTIWLDQYGLPVRANDETGLQAVEDRYVRHR
ncbi:MAG: hypothetical protein PVH65_15280 [Chloroflexota bacterium]|jgi:hypothetical protein